MGQLKKLIANLIGRFTSWSREDHKEPIFGVAFNPYNHPDNPPTFATVGTYFVD